MKEVLRPQLLRRLLMLVVLLAGLAFVLADERAARQAVAAPCCEECDAAHQQCLDECTTTACRRECIEMNHSCLEHCVMCGGGGGGGGACQTSADCPYIQGYGFGYCVGGNCVY